MLCPNFARKKNHPNPAALPRNHWTYAVRIPDRFPAVVDVAKRFLHVASHGFAEAMVCCALIVAAVVSVPPRIVGAVVPLAGATIKTAFPWRPTWRAVSIPLGPIIFGICRPAIFFE
jgi:hypothetical protein